MHRRPNESGDGSAPVLTDAEAARHGDTLDRVMAHGLGVVVSVVPAAVGIFYTVSRRLAVGDGVFTAAPALRSVPDRWARQVSGGALSVPFAPRRIAALDVPVVGVEQLGGRQAFAGSPYGEFLAGEGIGDEVALYVRASGAIVGGISLMRQTGEPHFAPNDLLLLRRLQPLIEHVYVEVREPAQAGEGTEALLTASLTPREAEVAKLVGSGASNAEIARALYMSLATVKTHLTQIYAKLGVRNRTQLAILLRPTARPD